MITFEVAKSHKRKHRFTRSIIFNHLYVKETWGIFTSIDKFKINPSVIDTVILVKSENKYVGCCMYVPGHTFTLQTFVLPAFRRKGIGTALLKRIRKANPNVDFIAETICKKNRAFYSKLPKKEQIWNSV